MYNTKRILSIFSMGIFLFVICFVNANVSTYAANPEVSSLTTQQVPLVGHYMFKTTATIGPLTKDFNTRLIFQAIAYNQLTFLNFDINSVRVTDNEDTDVTALRFITTNEQMNDTTFLLWLNANFKAGDTIEFSFYSELPYGQVQVGHTGQICSIWYDVNEQQISYLVPSYAIAQNM